MKSLVTICHNLMTLFIMTALSGFIAYNLFDLANWWNPLTSGIIMGGIAFGCTLPRVIININASKMKETEK